MSGVDDSENVGVAVALVIGAGLSTALGAAVVFFPFLVKLASRRVLAGALGISAGVMTYVSFIEIFGKSQASFEDAGYEEKDAYLYATLCFFGGVVVMLLMDVGVKLLSGGHHHHHQNETSEAASDPVEQVESDEPSPITSVCCSPDPAGDLETIQRQAAELEERQGGGAAAASAEGGGEVAAAPAEEIAETQVVKDDSAPADNKRLVRMGVNTALAIGLHNFPEGLATFVATLDDPSVGAVLAIAIGIHNIPEGLCVALPIYYATGNRTKAFAWAMLSGISEPVAALLGYAILANSFSDTLYAVMFGLVGGMMVMISTRELLPTAHRYDPDDTVVTYSFIAGMAIMALSLVLFVL